MNEVVLNGDEKAVLRFLYDTRHGDMDGFSELTSSRKSAACRSLKAKGLIIAHFEEDGKVVTARATNEGIAYIDGNPNLDDPASVELERLQKENLILQNNDLEYKVKIRKQESVIRAWKLACAIIGFIGAVGWLLRFFD